MTKPRLTVEQIKNIRVQAQVAQDEGSEDFFATRCEELADDLLHMHRISDAIKDNLMKWKTK